MKPAVTASNPRSDAAAHVAHLNERVVETGRRAGSAYLDTYEKFVGRVIAVQQSWPGGRRTTRSARSWRHKQT